MPAYRDDHDALLARADALTRENEQLRRENEELRAQKEAPPPPPAVIAPAAPAKRSRLDRNGVIVTLSAVSAVMLAAVFAPWMVTVVMLPAAVVLIALAIRESVRSDKSKKRKKSKRLSTGSVSIDMHAYHELLDTTRKTVNVQLDVTFEVPLAPTQRSEIEQQLAAANLRSQWEQDTLQVRSRRLRIERKGKERDPSLIATWCSDAFSALERIHRSWPISVVRPRASSGNLRR